MPAPYLLFLFNAVAPEARRGAFADCTTWSTVQALRLALARSGYRVYPVNLRSPRQLERLLERLPHPDLAFVIAEGFLERPTSLYDGSGPALIRRLLARHGVPATHSSPPAMRRCRHKHLTYRALARRGLLVPAHHLVLPFERDWPRRLSAAARHLGFPHFVKPNGGSNSLGISRKSVA